MTNTGPPWFADSPDEAARAMLKQKEERARAAYQAGNQARLKGNPTRALQLLWGMLPLKGR